ncbi:MAG: hypothetical protein WB341_08570 [Terracidiphilus sp.]
MQICGKKALIEGRLVRIARLDAEGYDFLDDPEEALKALRSYGTRIDLFTFIQKLSDTSPKYRYRMEWDNFAALEVSTFENWVAHQIDFKARNKVRKTAKHGVLVREVVFDENLVKGISAIYNESPVRQGKPFWHYGKSLEAVRRMNETFLDRSIFIGALFEDNLIGFVKLVSNEDSSQAGLMQIVSMIQHRDKAPTNALIAQAVRSCAERGIPYLWYANFSYGKKQEDSLAEFKRHNGFQKVDVPRYYIPLTLLGQMGLQLGIHHEAADWIPEPVANAFRKIRSRWYTRRSPVIEST